MPAFLAFVPAWCWKLVAIAVAVAAIWGHGYMTSSRAHDKEYAARALKEQQAYAAEIQRIRTIKDAELGALQDSLAAAQGAYEKKRKEHQDAKAKNDRFERDLRDGRIVLVDPGAGVSGGATGAAPAGGCDGAPSQPGRLSPQLGAFLFSEADRADGIIEDLEVRLELAQSVVTAYYELAKACSAGASGKSGDK